MRATLRARIAAFAGLLALALVPALALPPGASASAGQVSVFEDDVDGVRIVAAPIARASRSKLS